MAHNHFQVFWHKWSRVGKYNKHILNTSRNLKETKYITKWLNNQRSVQPRSNISIIQSSLTKSHTHHGTLQSRQVTLQLARAKPQPCSGSQGIGRISSWVEMVDKLARRWDNLSMVRSRFRKGKPWLKTKSNKDGDLIIDTPALEWNHPILTATLQSCGQKPSSIDEMVKQVGCTLVVHVHFLESFSPMFSCQFSTLKFPSQNVSIEVPFIIQSLP